MKSKKLTLAKPFRFNEILRLSIFFMLTMGLLSGCMVVRFDAHLATKGTKIKSDNDEDTGGPSTGTYGLHLKNGYSAEADGPPSEAKDHGDTQIGGGVEMMVGPKLGEDTEILGVLGYDRYYYFVGNDDFVKFGLQGRRTFGNDSFWLGAEASYVKDWAYIKDITDNPDVGMAGCIFNPMTQQLEYRRTRTANGWMAGVLGGYKIKQVKSMDMSIFAGAYFMHLGDFKSKLDEITKDCHNNLHFKAGIEVGLPFSK
jgi:hypothetical protein